MCRVPGVPNSYKAELVGILLGSHFSPEGEQLHLDCQGAIASAVGSKRPVRQARWVTAVRQSLQSKKQSLCWVEGHAGIAHNEASDHYAKLGTTLPLPPPQTSSSPWDVVRHGELMAPPHKVWTHDLIPTHSHEHFHPVSWRPLKFRRLAWHKWLFGLQSRMGYQHYTTFWRDETPVVCCPICHSRHNSSVHGVLAFCSRDHPLVKAWLDSWPHPESVARWRATALRRDLRIVGRLAVPHSLYKYLRTTQGGLSAARRQVGRFQRSVLDSVTSALSECPPPPPNAAPQCFRPHPVERPHAALLNPVPAPVRSGRTPVC